MESRVPTLYRNGYSAPIMSLSDVAWVNHVEASHTVNNINQKSESMPYYEG